MKWPTGPRIRGRKLQQRRLRVWSRDPSCAHCQKITAYPDGFELDHTTALDNGGPDTEDNCQVLCPDCHLKKTVKDMGYVDKPTFDKSGRVEW